MCVMVISSQRGPCGEGALRFGGIRVKLAGTMGSQPRRGQLFWGGTGEWQTKGRMWRESRLALDQEQQEAGVSSEQPATCAGVSLEDDFF